MSRREHEIIEEARRQVEERRRRRAGTDSLRWFLLLWASVLLLFFLAPWPLEGKLWAAVHGLCSQQAGHLLSFGGKLLPLCARDSGLYLGALVGMVYLLARGRWRAAGRPARWAWIVLIVILALFAADVINSVAHEWFGGGLYTPHNALRLITGLLLGLTISVALLWAINLSFTGRKRERAILSHWMDLVGLALAGAAAGAGLWSGWPALYLPLTVLSVAGLVALLLAANALWIVVATRGKKLLDNLWEAIPLLWWGSLATVVEMAVLSWLRYRLGL